MGRITLSEYAEQMQISERYRTKKVNVVMLAGKALAGKTTAAQYLQRSLNTSNTCIEPLALPIKQIASDFFGWDGKKDDRGRKLLQEIGDAGIDYDRYLFPKKLEDRTINGLFMPYFVFIDDWRYPAESEYFKNNFLYDVTTIRVERGETISGDVAKHRSENSLPEGNIEHLEIVKQDDTYDFVLYNNGTLKQFIDKLNNVVAYLQTKLIIY